ncbi:hypothetical protein AVEN_17318-1 [Araneus ventricosus]|uniref:Uncharacterized protein n=1 Tax=Araneus ventricosus TaxID=182803 RepID=A0A4Y2WHD3_ARAVE|nr:hypothetical protein AVEN_17318-1 [Araneus ventricosus]
MWDWCTLNLASWVKHPPPGVLRKFGKKMPTQVSASSSDRSTKWSPKSSQNILNVSSKRHLNETKLLLNFFEGESSSFLNSKLNFILNAFNCVRVTKNIFPRSMYS